MATRLKRAVLSPIPFVFRDATGQFVARLWSGSLIKELYGEITDEFLERLLRGMDLAFCLSSGYRENIKDFEGRYVFKFKTEDGDHATSVTFKDGDMAVYEEEIDNPDIEIIFRNANALWAFIFSKNQDILDSILKNEVEVDGNLNYIYKFGFLARDLGHRLGVG